MITIFTETRILESYTVNCGQTQASSYLEYSYTISPNTLTVWAQFPCCSSINIFVALQWSPNLFK